MKITCFKLQESYNDLDEILLNEVEILSETESANNKFIELESFRGDRINNLSWSRNAIGSAVSAGLQAEWWFTEPPKSTVDFVKDGVKDAAHYVCDKLARIFW